MTHGWTGCHEEDDYEAKNDDRYCDCFSYCGATHPWVADCRWESWQSKRWRSSGRLDPWSAETKSYVHKIILFHLYDALIVHTVWWIDLTDQKIWSLQIQSTVRSDEMTLQIDISRSPIDRGSDIWSIIISDLREGMQINILISSNNYGGSIFFEPQCHCWRIQIYTYMMSEVFEMFEMFSVVPSLPEWRSGWGSV